MIAYALEFVGNSLTKTDYQTILNHNSFCKTNPKIIVNRNLQKLTAIIEGRFTIIINNCQHNYLFLLCVNEACMR
jgi:hypothetical protein